MSSNGRAVVTLLTDFGLQDEYAGVMKRAILPLAIFDSRGLLEIAVSCGSAAQALGISVGDPVVLREK